MPEKEGKKIELPVGEGEFGPVLAGPAGGGIDGQPPALSGAADPTGDRDRRSTDSTRSTSSRGLNGLVT